MEKRVLKLERDVSGLKHEVADHAKLHAQARKDIDMLQEILKETQRTNDLIANVVEYAKKTYEVFEPLARVSGKIARIGTFFMASYYLVKTAIIKLAAFQF